MNTSTPEAEGFRYAIAASYLAKTIRDYAT